MKQFYSVAEFSEITGLSPDTIRKFIHDRVIYASRGKGNRSHYLIPHTQLLRLRGEKNAIDKKD